MWKVNIKKISKDIEKKGDKALEACSKIVLPPPSHQLNCENDPCNTSQSSKPITSPEKIPNQPIAKTTSQTEDSTFTSNNSSNHLSDQQTSNNTLNKVEVQQEEIKGKDKARSKKRISDTKSGLSCSTCSDTEIPPCPPCPPFPSCPCPIPCQPDSNPNPLVLEKGINTESSCICHKSRRLFKNKKCQVHCIIKTKLFDNKCPRIKPLYTRCSHRGCCKHHPLITRNIKKRNTNENGKTFFTRMYNIFKDHLKNPLTFINYLRSKGIIMIKNPKNC